MGSCYSCKGSGGHYMYTTVTMAKVDNQLCGGDSLRDNKRRTPYQRENNRGLANSFGFHRRTASPTTTTGTTTAPTVNKASLSQERTQGLVSLYESKHQPNNKTTAKNPGHHHKSQLHPQQQGIMKHDQVAPATSTVSRFGFKKTVGSQQQKDDNCNHQIIGKTAGHTTNSGTNDAAIISNNKKAVDLDVTVRKSPITRRSRNSSPDLIENRNKQAAVKKCNDDVTNGNTQQQQSKNSTTMKLKTQFAGLPKPQMPLYMQTAKPTPSVATVHHHSTATNNFNNYSVGGAGTGPVFITNGSGKTLCNKPPPLPDLPDPMQISSDNFCDDDYCIGDSDSGIGNSVSEKNIKVMDGDTETLSGVEQIDFYDLTSVDSIKAYSLNSSPSRNNLPPHSYYNNTSSPEASSRQLQHQNVGKKSSPPLVNNSNINGRGQNYVPTRVGSGPNKNGPTPNAFGFVKPVMSSSQAAAPPSRAIPQQQQQQQQLPKPAAAITPAPQIVPVNPPVVAETAAKVQPAALPTAAATLESLRLVDLEKLKLGPEHKIMLMQRSMTKSMTSSMTSSVTTVTTAAPPPASNRGLTPERERQHLFHITMKAGGGHGGATTPRTKTDVSDSIEDISNEEWKLAHECQQKEKNCFLKDDVGDLSLMTDLEQTIRETLEKCNLDDINYYLDSDKSPDSSKCYDLKSKSQQQHHEGSPMSAEENHDSLSTKDSGPFSPPSERDDFLIDDEISDQPALIADFGRDYVMNKTFTKSGRGLSEDNADDTFTDTMQRTLQDMSGLDGSISPCSSLSSDDLMLDYGKNDDGLVESINEKDKTTEKNDDASNPRNSSGATNNEKTQSVPSLISEWASLVGSYTSDGMKSPSNLYEIPSRRSAPSLRPPKPMSAAEVADGVKIDSSSYRYMCQDITNIKTMLLMLKRVLHENPCMAETINPFDSSFKNGLFLNYANNDSSEASSKLADTSENSKERTRIEIEEENADLKRQIVLLQQQLDEKDKTIKTLNHRLDQCKKSSQSSDEFKLCNAASQTERQRVFLNSSLGPTADECVSGATVSCQNESHG